MAHRIAKWSTAGAAIVVALAAMLPIGGGAQQSEDVDATSGTTPATPVLAGFEATPTPSTVQEGGLWSEGASPMGDEEAARGDWSVGCGFGTAVKTGTITLGEVDVATPCIVVSAGDLVTWVNPTGTTMAIQAGDDQFSTEDVSSTFSTLEVPAQGEVTVRVTHAGRIDYTAADHPEINGTILVLGRGGA